MRIAMIDPSLFTFPYDCALAKGLQTCGHTVHLHACASQQSETTFKTEADFYKVSHTSFIDRMPKAIRLGVKGLEHGVDMVRLRRSLARSRPDIIHFQWLALPTLDRLQLASLGRIAPLILTVHDTNPFNGDPSTRFQGAGFREALNFFSALIVHTRQGFERLIAMGLPESRISIVPHGLLTEIAPAETPALDFEGGVTFVTFGKIKPYKGIDLLLEAFARLSPELQARARLRVVGKPYMDVGPLRRLAETLGISSRFDLEPRFVSDTDVSRQFTTDTVAVFPYREIEASGVLALAMAYGRPVVASRLGGFVEAIEDGVTGKLFDVGDVHGLSAALGSFCINPSLVEKYSAAMRSAAKAVPSWQEIGDQTYGVYRRAHALWAAQQTSAGRLASGAGD